MHCSDFWKVEDWQILDAQVFHFFNEEETILEAVNVQIGILTVYKTKICGIVIEEFPITRWLPYKKYLHFIKQSGVVIF